MNVILNLCDLQQEEFPLRNVIHFLDTKPNNIMVGDFTKLIYSNENFTLNGLYMHIKLEAVGEKKIEHKNKQILRFHSNHLQNISVIHSLIQIEHKLLEIYYQYKKNLKKQAKFVLHQQLMNGFVHYYQECENKTGNFVLKISGIWETNNAYGITYKFIEM
jgi:hypothetical protein